MLSLIQLLKTNDYDKNCADDVRYGTEMLSKPLYDSDGKYRSDVQDVLLNNALKIRKIVCDNGLTFNRGQIMGCCDAVIVRIPKPKTIASKAVCDKKQANNKVDSEQKRPIKTETELTEIKQNTQHIAKAYPIRRRYGDFGFLLNKIADKNITNFYNEVMIRRGESVTPEILRQAKRSGKLIELCLHVE